MLSDKINQDLKTAMLARDSELTEVLKGLKTAIQYAAVSASAPSELSEEDIMSVLKKEYKKRTDAADLYAKAGDEERQNKELYEKEVIEKYLPESMPETEISDLIDKAANELGGLSQQNMGQIIGAVKQASKGAADGSVIARLVKEKL